MRKLIFILLAFISLASYGQTKQTIKQLTVNDSLTIKAGNPAANKIATSIDGNGRFRWQYFSVFQDSINTGVYDSLLINYLNANSVRVKRDSFTDPAATIASIGDSGLIVECFTCDTIQYLLDSVGLWRSSLFEAPSGDTIHVYVPKYSGSAVNLIDDTDGDYMLRTGTFMSEIYFGAKAIGGYRRELVNDTTFTNALVGATFKGVPISVRQRFSIPPGVLPFAWWGWIYGDSLDNVSRPQIKLGSYHGYVTIADTASSHVIVYSDTFTVADSAGNILMNIANDKLFITDGTQANGYVLTSNASGKTTWQDKTAYGEMGFGDSTRTLALTQNVWSVVTNTAKNLLSEGATSLHNVTYQADSLKIDSAGTYLITANISVDGQTGSVIEFGVFKNGVLMCTCTGQTELLNNRIIQISYNDIAPLVSGDGLRLVLMNTANNDDVDLISAKLTINKIR
jgi:hypothetical protein